MLYVNVYLFSCLYWIVLSRETGSRWARKRDGMHQLNLHHCGEGHLGFLRESVQNLCATPVNFLTLEHLREQIYLISPSQKFNFACRRDKHRSLSAWPFLVLLLSWYNCINKRPDLLLPNLWIRDLQSQKDSTDRLLGSRGRQTASQGG